MMHNLGNRRSVQKCAQKAGSSVLNVYRNHTILDLPEHLKQNQQFLISFIIVCVPNKGYVIVTSYNAYSVNKVLT